MAKVYWVVSIPGTQGATQAFSLMLCTQSLDICPGVLGQGLKA